ncbi:hypothetical protein QZH41_015122 [Actinostola sp. cb2023]|nr:hypothetical protein QZH41_015122 [Actinostola sp. cb2023]
MIGSCTIMAQPIGMIGCCTIMAQPIGMIGCCTIIARPIGMIGCCTIMAQPIGMIGCCTIMAQPIGMIGCCTIMAQPIGMIGCCTIMAQPIGMIGCCTIMAQPIGMIGCCTIMAQPIGMIGCCTIIARPIGMIGCCTIIARPIGMIGCCNHGSTNRNDWMLPGAHKRKIPPPSPPITINTVVHESEAKCSEGVEEKKKPEMAADSEFVFDAVIGFLTSPIWNTPVPTFIEQNCLVFDPDEDHQEAYKEIHEKYKQMVETLLSSFLKDIGITAEQFTAACQARGGNAQFNEIRKNVFEQVWSAEDFEVFRRMMIKKNIELQLQALQLIQQGGHQVSGSTIPPLVQQETDEEDAIMKEVLRLSKEEYEKRTNDQKKEDDNLKKTLTQSFEEHESQSITKALEEAENAFELRLKLLAQREQGKLENALKACTVTQSQPALEADHTEHEVLLKDSKTLPEMPSTSLSSSAISDKPKPQKVKAKQTDLPPLTGVPKTSIPADAAANWLSNAKAEVPTSAAVSKEQEAKISEDEMKRRTEYLKLQRDKLLQMKKQQREKNLVKFTEDQPKTRPMSARAARRATAGEHSGLAPSAASPPDDKKLAMRRALADVLKREVIDKH